MRKLALLGLIAAVLELPASSPAMVAPGGAARGVPGVGFGPVSLAWGISLRSFFESPHAQPAGMPALLQVLQKLDVTVPEQRESLAPVVAALKELGYTPGQFAGEDKDGTGWRVLMSLALVKGAESARAEAGRLAAAAKVEPADAESLARTVAGMRRILDTFPMYFEKPAAPEETGPLEEFVAAEASARARLSALRGLETEDRVRRTEEALGKAAVGPTEGPAEAASRPEAGSRPRAGRRREPGSRPESEAVARAHTLAEALEDSEPAKAIANARQLEALASRHQDEALHRLAGGALGAALLHAEDPPAAQALAAALGRLGASTPFDFVKEKAARDLMVYALVAEPGPALRAAGEAVGIAVESPSRKIRESVRSFLRDMRRSAEEEAYQEQVQDLLDLVLDKPGSEEGPAGPPAPGPGSQALGDLWAQLRTGIRNHPVGAVFAAIALAGTLSTLAAASAPPLAFPLLGLVPAAAAGLYVAAKGLWFHHPVATFFQLLNLGGLVEEAAKAGGVGALPLILLAAGAAGGAAIASWSFKEHRPVLGWFLNLLFLSVMTAVVLVSI